MPSSLIPKFGGFNRLLQHFKNGGGRWIITDWGKGAKGLASYRNQMTLQRYMTTSKCLPICWIDES